jgi:putative ABC transport system permease protein
MFPIRNLLKVALKSISRNRTRSALTSLGIIIGVCSVIVMVAIGEGSRKRIEREISSLGTNVITVFPASMQVGGVSSGAGGLNRLTLRDADKVKTEATLLAGVSPVVRAHAQVIGGGKNWSTGITGGSPEYATIRGWTVAKGEFFTDRDVVSNAKVAVLGSTVAEELFGNQDPLGQRIQIGGTPLKVVGVMAEKGQNAMGMDEDDVIIAPATTVLYRIKGGTYIDMINAKAASTEQLDEAQAELRSILREAHHLRESVDDDFSIRNLAELTEMATETSRILTLLLGSIAGVSLLVGGIGIMNIMLVSVTERTREIGIRLSLGARTTDILTQFLAEAMVLSAAGGVLGVLLAVGISLVLNDIVGVAASMNPWITALAFSVSGAVGVFFGLYPARKAAALNPIDALRYE